MVIVLDEYDRVEDDDALSLIARILSNPCLIMLSRQSL